jgi:membrane protein implicated in regulation of membrane protease activity
MTGDEWVRVNGELWRARGGSSGEQVRVRRVDGLTLDVEPL